MTTIRANKLTTFSVAQDGATVSIGVTDEHGAASALVLPASCLHALVLTLPEMAQQALQRKYSDTQVRLVFPVENWKIETSEAADRLILTFATADGFRASFALFLEELVDMAGTALAGKNASSLEAEAPGLVN